MNSRIESRYHSFVAGKGVCFSDQKEVIMDVNDENDDENNTDSGDWLQPSSSKRGKLKVRVS